jgi:hypothetical protein
MMRRHACSAARQADSGPTDGAQTLVRYRWFLCPSPRAPRRYTQEEANL